MQTLLSISFQECNTWHHFKSCVTRKWVLSRELHWSPGPPGAARAAKAAWAAMAARAATAAWATRAALAALAAFGGFCRTMQFPGYVWRKCAIRSLLLSYSKKEWRAGPRQSLFEYDTDYKIALRPPILLLVWQRQRSYGTFSRDMALFILDIYRQLTKYL